MARVPTSSAGDPLIGTVLEGRYRIDARVGAGGMGAVYRAFQLSTGRDVALKVLIPGLSEDESIIQRFQNEARAIAKLRSPHTLKLIDSGGTDEGRLFIVTELLVGEPLNAMLKRELLGLPRAISFLKQIATSLEEAHAAGIVHRDLKPANIFVERIGEQEVVKVLDFGIAKLAEQPNLTATGLLLGTPSYMSPEQGRAGQIDARSDVYSLGVIAYECFSGGVPFKAQSSVALLLKHAGEPPPPLDGAQVPPEIESLVLSMLAKEPEQRPQSAAIVRRELERLERRFDPSAAPPSEPALPPPEPAAEVNVQFSNTMNSYAGELGTLEEPPAGNKGLRTLAGVLMAAALLAVGAVYVFGPRPPTVEALPAPVPHPAVVAPPPPASVAPPPAPIEAPPPPPPPALEVAPKPVADTVRKTPPRPPPPPVAALGPGRVLVKVQTSAGRALETPVFVDGIERSQHTPAVLELEPGSHVVEIRPDGYPVQRRKLTISAGKEESVRFTAD